MILYRIDYQGGEIWVDKDAQIEEGWKGCAYKDDVKGKVFEHFYTTNPWYKDAMKIVAQSTNLSLPNIPYVEIEEDVQELSKKYINNTLKDSESDDYFLGRMKGYEDGYKNTVAKKYTEEDLRKALLEYAKWITGGVPSLRFASTPEEAMSKIIQSINPKPVSIEVETKETGAVCETCNKQGVRHCAYPEECGAWKSILTPVTYTKDGKTFLKIEKLNYEPY